MPSLSTRSGLGRFFPKLPLRRELSLAMPHCSPQMAQLAFCMVVKKNPYKDFPPLQLSFTTCERDTLTGTATKTIMNSMCTHAELHRCSHVGSDSAYTDAFLHLDAGFMAEVEILAFAHRRFAMRWGCPQLTQPVTNGEPLMHCSFAERAAISHFKFGWSASQIQRRSWYRGCRPPRRKSHKRLSIKLQSLMTRLGIMFHLE